MIPYPLYEVLPMAMHVDLDRADELAAIRLADAAAAAAAAAENARMERADAALAAAQARTAAAALLLAVGHGVLRAELARQLFVVLLLFLLARASLPPICAAKPWWSRTPSRPRCLHGLIMSGSAIVIS